MSTPTHTIKIAGHQAPDGGWSAHSPQVRGVFGHGESFPDAVADWRQAAELYRETFGTLEFIDDQSATPDAVEIQTIPDA
jgi:predicted RNase H-like HicB family nuclease